MSFYVTRHISCSRNGESIPTSKSLTLLSSRKGEWAAAGTLDYCRSLLVEPKPFNKECKFHRTHFKCQNSSSQPVMFGQYFQDYYLYVNHFKYLNRPGIYVDIATNEPISISNTFFFDRCLQWRGICVEANDMYFEGIYRERSCQLVPTCVGSKDGESVQFNLYGGYGGIVGDTYKHSNRKEVATNAIRRKQLRCTTMENVSKSYGVSKIDYLSLDVEGHELAVLKGFGLQNNTISVMTIEGTRKDHNEIDKYLTEMGYKRHFVNFDYESHGLKVRGPGLLVEDAVYLHRSVEFGKPT